MSAPVVWFEALGQYGDDLNDFYAEVLGWRHDPRRARAATALRRAAATPRRSARPGAKPPWWVTFYTPVPDLDAAVAKARAFGSQVLVAPTRHGDTVIAVVSDPEGHPVGLCT
jgi:predicted enzyme related to lactoylglutathione lyase